MADNEQATKLKSTNDLSVASAPNVTVRPESVFRELSIMMSVEQTKSQLLE